MMKSLALLLLYVAAARASFRAGYVIGGEDTEITDWPFMVSLQSGTGFHSCGAVLISTTRVLTAAHCVDGVSPSARRIMLGTNSVDRPVDPLYYDLTEIIVHEDYGSGAGIQNDVALLYVDGEVAVNGVTVEPIVMAERDAEDFVGAECQIAGWGQTEDDGSPDILKFAPVNVISVEACQDDWFWASEQHICIRDDNGEFGACFGDSGGPMTCIDSAGQRVLVGTTSGGNGNCITTIAAFYARTSFFYDWIQENM